MHKPGTSPVYSPSRISTYESCPRQYRYRYIDRIPREEESIEAFLGSRVHEALNRLYRDLLLEKHPHLDELLNYYDTEWRRRWHDQVRIVKQDNSIEDYKRLGERCLKDYHDAHKPFDRGLTLGLEHRVTSSLDPVGRYRIQGYIDRLVSVGSGRYEIHDFKTSGRLPVQGVLDADRQLALYQLGVQGTWPEAKEIELVWHYLAFGKELRSRRTPEALDRLKATTIALIDRIEADTEFRPIKSALCHWCAYKDICPVWNDRPVIIEKSSKFQVPGSASPFRVPGSEFRVLNPEPGTWNSEPQDGRSIDTPAPEDKQAIDMRAVSREALREAILAAAETEGAEIRFTDHGDLWVRMAQLTPPAALDGRADGWTQLFDESLPLLFRQVERARWSATFVEKLERYLAS
jgi:putative RecB family exonuclease